MTEKAFVVTIVANVATERIGLDTTDIECSKKKFQLLTKSCFSFDNMVWKARVNLMGF
jgi:hypothetical protein